MTELVTFPRWGEPKYEDSGEGGLFVMLFVPEPDEWAHGCHVDVAIEASRPDVMVHPHSKERELWAPYDFEDTKLEMAVYDVLREHGKEGMLRWAATARGPEYRSVDMLAAMHLGSTPGSFWCASEGHYWYAEYDSLTPAGKALYDGMKAAYGVEPILATFLDT